MGLARAMSICVDDHRWPRQSPVQRSRQPGKIERAERNPVGVALQPTMQIVTRQTGQAMRLANSTGNGETATTKSQTMSLGACAKTLLRIPISLVRPLGGENWPARTGPRQAMGNRRWPTKRANIALLAAHRR